MKKRKYRRRFFSMFLLAAIMFPTIAYAAPPTPTLAFTLSNSNTPGYSTHMNQGMASDGTNLYIAFYKLNSSTTGSSNDEYSRIWKYTTSGTVLSAPTTDQQAGHSNGLEYYNNQLYCSTKGFVKRLNSSSPFAINYNNIYSLSNNPYNLNYNNPPSGTVVGVNMSKNQLFVACRQTSGGVLRFHSFSLSTPGSAWINYFSIPYSSTRTINGVLQQIPYNTLQGMTTHNNRIYLLAGPTNGIQHIYIISMIDGIVLGDYTIPNQGESEGIAEVGANLYYVINTNSDAKCYYVPMANASITPPLSKGWKQNATGWWYEYSDGSWPANRWQFHDGNWYYFNASGYMITGGPHSIDGEQYSFNANGQCINPYNYL